MAVDSRQKSAETVYRAGTKDNPSFDLKDESMDEVWLATSPELFFPLGQDLPVSSQKRLEELVCLWMTDVSNLSKDFTYSLKYDGVIQLKLNDSRNTKNPVKEIQKCLASLDWHETTVPQCEGGLALMDCSLLVQAVIVYMKDHYPTTPEELNFHAELKAASQWCCSDDYKHLVLKKVPVGDCRLKIAATETLKTWEKMEKDLDIDASDKCVDKQLSDVKKAIGVLKNYLEQDKREPIGVSKNHLGGDKKDMEPILAFPTPPESPEQNVEESAQQSKAAACEGAMAPVLDVNFMEEQPSAAGRKSPRNGSPKKRKHEANGGETVPPKKIKPARQRFSRRVSKRR